MKVFEQVVFMQDENADEAFEILNNEGEAAALEFLQQWHYPGEHETRAETASGTFDPTYEKDGYIMVWNPRMNYIGLEYETDE
jgi:hypothetical protein